MATMLKRAPIVVMLVLGLALLGFVAGCGSDETDEATETTVAAETATTTAADDEATESTDGAGSETTPETQADAGGTDYAAQVPELEAQVEENPEDLATLQDLAIAYYQTGQYEQAVETYQKMLDIEDSAVVHNNLGNVYRDWEKTDEAIQQYETAIELDPTLASAYTNLAMLYALDGQTEEAVSVLQRGLDNVVGDMQTQLQQMMEQFGQQ